ncbi:MAG: glycoside hydrolase family 57 protein [Gammaproteobacteria bacterium]|nr:glycoside hydrolase family 57 protein [Gammaproteobacteria bacterium]
MSDKNQLKVVLCWHMHQPEYRELMDGIYQLPWTYLHAIKDYVDMASILEETPKAKAVINFAPILLEQIEDYATQVKSFLHGSGSIKDPLLAALDMPALPNKSEERWVLIEACLRANEERLINRFPHYRRLVDMANWYHQNDDLKIYMDDQFLTDLLVWYHLAWMGETVRRKSKCIQQLCEKGQNYTLSDRRKLLGVISEQLSSIIERYRVLSAKNQIELSMTPYAHPIMPLMQDLQCTKDAMPDASLPKAPVYPGGQERLKWHLEKGIDTFQRFFGKTPRGCWPSEGGVSSDTLHLLNEYGFDWAATGESVFHNSLTHHGISDSDTHDGHELYHPYHIKGTGNIRCFFRDDGLSDLIGFTYSNWHADDAVGDLIHHLENINVTCQSAHDSVVSIILDGENAWEHYPDNGYHFLSALYKRLSEHPNIELTTFSECLDAKPKAGKLSGMVSGSWVYGTFSTWIGDTDKNAGWDLLIEAKHAYDAKVAANEIADENREAVDKQLAICEGSDWFWWFGDYNSQDAVSDFERLFRMHLANLYQMLNLEPPESLSKIISHGGGDPLHGGAMRPGKEQN